MCACVPFRTSEECSLALFVFLVLLSVYVDSDPCTDSTDSTDSDGVFVLCVWLGRRVLYLLPLTSFHCLLVLPFIT